MKTGSQDMALSERAVTKLLLFSEGFLSATVMKLAKFIVHLFTFTSTLKMASFALKIKSKSPKTIEEKILYKMQHDRNPSLKIFSDKIQVRGFVQKEIGEEFLTKSLGEYSSLKGVNRREFPRNFVIKANHGSGASVICWEGAPRGRRLPSHLTNITWQRFFLHPDDLIWNDLQNLAEKWLTLEYYWFSGKLPEWAYLEINPQLIAEEVLTKNNELAEDYKFFMFDGRCEFIQVDISKFSNHRRNFYKPDWTRIYAEILYPASEVVQERPSSLEKMLEISSKISKDVDCMRVDLYDSDQGIKFGEITNYPGCGTKTMRPRKTSIELANKWIQDY